MDYSQLANLSELSRVTVKAHDAMECKINPDKLDAKPFEVFRELYPDGDNYLISPAVKEPYKVRWGRLVFTVCNTGNLPS